MMEKNRIQKLLLAEYKDFSDLVLVESPFAETTRNGRGVREVALGLTSSTLIIATDILRDDNAFTCPSDLDPSIETLELISIYPLELITLSIFRRRKRKTLKARLIDGRANYFELGGMNRREIFWSLWCEHIRILLSRKEHSSSLSETTAASSSSTSTLYLHSSEVDYGIDGNVKKRNRCICRLWAYYCGAGDIPPTWTKKDIFMGSSHNELGPDNYLPVPMKIPKSNMKYLRKELQSSLDHIKSESHHELYRNKQRQMGRKENCIFSEDLCEILFTHENDDKRYFEHGDYTNPVETSSPIITKQKRSSKVKYGKNSRTSSHDSDHTTIPKLSRFGFGVEEKCTSGLYLPPSRRARKRIPDKLGSSEMFMDPYQIIESGVTLWEQDKWRRNAGNVGDRRKKLRRYALATAPHFLYALGPWFVHEGDKISVQSKRSLSCINIRRQPSEIELKLPISKRQLTTYVSMASLDQEISLIPSERSRVLLFWTTDYWYRPRSATATYRELHRHLGRLRTFQQTITEKNCRKFSMRKNNIDHHDNDNNGKIICDRATCVLNKIFSVKGRKKKKRKDNVDRARPTSKYRELLRMKCKITAWDFDSTTLAKQLTLIDRDLFLRIPITEIKVLIYQKSSRNAPNVGALIAFSHRISCLIATELLAIGNLNMRARILARFLNAAHKCFVMGNFQSCRSILAGLQSPAIYRLRSTWSHLKTHHSSVYEIMLKLCKIFKNPRTKIYRNAWENAEKDPPLLPYVCDIFIRILGLNKNSSSLYCECPEGVRNTKPQVMRTNWDGGSTFITQIDHRYEKPRNEQTISNNPKLNNVPIICKCRQKPKLTRNRESTAKKISSALMKLHYGKYKSTKSSRKGFFWAARKMILIRRYYERWHTFVIRAKIIRENEKKRKPADMRVRRIEEVTTWLIKCQEHAHEYDFSPHKLAWEFLLKTRYKEEKENFRISRQLEVLLD